jgi:hypothetical protein
LCAAAIKFAFELGEQPQGFAFGGDGLAQVAPFVILIVTGKPHDENAALLV